MHNLTEKLSQQLDVLCTQNSPIPQRIWVYGDEGKVYIRTTQRMIAPGEIHPTIDLATIEIDEEFQNQGVFKEILQMVEQKAQQYNRTVFLENVINEVLIQPLQNYGYSMVDDSFPPSFIKNQICAPTKKIKI